MLAGVNRRRQARPQDMPLVLINWAAGLNLYAFGIRMRAFLNKIRKLKASARHMCLVRSLSSRSSRVWAPKLPPVRGIVEAQVFWCSRWSRHGPRQGLRLASSRQGRYKYVLRKSSHHSFRMPHLPFFDHGNLNSRGCRASPNSLHSGPPVSSRFLKNIELDLLGFCAHHRQRYHLLFQFPPLVLIQEVKYFRLGGVTRLGGQEDFCR